VLAVFVVERIEAKVEQLAIDKRFTAREHNPQRRIFKRRKMLYHGTRFRYGELNGFWTRTVVAMVATVVAVMRDNPIERIKRHTTYRSDGKLNPNLGKCLKPEKRLPYASQKK
jgi:hypothetical protein